MDKCRIGVLLKDDCHKLTFTRTKAIKHFKNITNEDQVKILWRAGLLDSFDHENATVCLHHELVFGRAFERRVIDKCYNVFDTHSRKVKGGHTISLELARVLKESGWHVVPGWKLCRSCYDRANSEVQNQKQPGNDTLELELENDPISSGEEIEDRDISRESLKKHFEAAGVSPLKLHGLVEQRKIKTAKDKLARVRAHQEAETARVIGVDLDEIRPTTSSDDSINKETKEKAAEFDKFIYLLKEKIKTSCRREKVKILTLTPDSWSRKFAAEFFQVSEYLVRTARALKKEKGILAEPAHKRGRVLSKDVEDLVRSFYEDDEFSRMMPGRKDYVSLSRNVHKQKRLLLCNLRELFSAFKDRNPGIAIGFSKFCTLRPKWCVTTGSPGTHTVCVCTHHQNAVLLVNAIDWPYTYKDLIKIVVCDDDRRECMVHRCNQCPGASALKEFVTNKLEELEEGDIHFNQWQSTDRSTLITQTATVDEYVDLLVESIDHLTSHSYIAKSQGRYLKKCKAELVHSDCIVLLDFAENFKFVVQDEVQGYHWNNQQCTLHPVVVYYKDEQGDLQEFSLCILSDDMNHDTCFVYEVQRLTIELIKRRLPGVTKVQYFSDGCASQYKNYKNFLNVCYHKEDFGLDADWTFFATSHGKSPCDGIGGTIKRLTTRASLQRPPNDQIMSTAAMFEFGKSSISVIHFEMVAINHMTEVRNMQEERFQEGKTIPGTRSYHFFQPMTTGLGIKYKRTSDDPEFSGEILFRQPVATIDLANLQLMQFVCCSYDGFWWVGMVQEIDNEQNDIKIKFMHPHGPTKNFYWPSREDSCWVPYDKIVCHTEAPATSSGRMYKIKDTDYQKIIQHTV